MSYLALVFGLAGARLQYVFCNSAAEELGAETHVLITQLHVPEQRYLPTEMSYLTSLLGGYVASVGVQGYLGEQSMIVLQRGVDAAQLHTLLARAGRLTGGLEIIHQIGLEYDQVVGYYSSDDPDPGALKLLGATDWLKGLAAELCGYPTSDLTRLAGATCAFPEEPHSCRGEFFTDVFQAWIDGNLRVSEAG